VYVFTDGCAEQYRCRKAAASTARFCEENQAIKDFIVTIAPTGGFKGICDSSGNEPKKWIKNRIKSQLIDGIDGARKAFDALQAMPQPVVPKDAFKRSQNQVLARHHWLMIDKADASQAEIDNMTNDNYLETKVIVTDYDKDYYDCKELSGIMSIYTMRCGGNASKSQVYFKKLPCFCNECIQQNWGACAFKRETGSWMERSIVNYKTGKPKEDVVSSSSKKKSSPI
jgi:hypothetical protein